MTELGWFNAPLIVAVLLSIWATLIAIAARDLFLRARAGRKDRLVGETCSHLPKPETGGSEVVEVSALPSEQNFKAAA